MNHCAVAFYVKIIHSRAKVTTDDDGDKFVSWEIYWVTARRLVIQYDARLAAC